MICHIKDLSQVSLSVPTGITYIYVCFYLFTLFWPTLLKKFVLLWYVHCSVLCITHANITYIHNHAYVIFWSKILFCIFIVSVYIPFVRSAQSDAHKSIRLPECLLIDHSHVLLTARPLECPPSSPLACPLASSTIWHDHIRMPTVACQMSAKWKLGPSVYPSSILICLSIHSSVCCLWLGLCLDA